MNETTKTTLKYLGCAALAATFVLFGIQNFRYVTSAPGFGQDVILGFLFLILDIILFVHWNRRALGYLGVIRDLKSKKNDP